MRARAINAIYDLALRDERVVFIGSDLGPGVLKEMQAEMPGRFFMEGVSEQHILGMAAGLAMEGYVPYINTIATFLTRRCYEQVAIDVGLHDLPVRLIASGGGAVYAPLGPTHMSLDDIALMRAVPNMTIVAACDAEEMTRVMDASLDWPHPMYIRLAKGGDPVISSPERGFSIGEPIVMRAGSEVAMISCGVMTATALAVADLLGSMGISAGVLHVHTIKPLGEASVLAFAADAKLLVTIEEHSLIGGLGSAICEAVADSGQRREIARFGLPDAFSHAYGNQEHVLASAGLHPQAIARSIAQRWHVASPRA